MHTGGVSPSDQEENGDASIVAAIYDKLQKEAFIRA